MEDRAVPALVAAYGFEESSGLTAVDSSGSNNPGTLSGPARVAGRFGQGLSFNGTNSWVTVADSNSLDLTTGMTLEAWVYPTDSNGWETVVLKERGTSGLAYSLYGSDGAGHPPAGYVNVGGSDHSAAGTSAIPLDTWTHLAVTYDGSVLRLYVNGSQVASQNQSGSVATTGSPLRIGGNAVWGEYFDGAIDEVRVYNTALTAAQIQTDMNTPVVSGPPDTTPPAVSVTAPAAGSTVTGTVTVSADASDNVGVSAVQFQVDGVSLGAEVTSAPYSVSWNSAGVANGTHTLTAVARDAAGNQTTSAPVAVTVAGNTGTPLTVDGARHFQTMDGFGVNTNVKDFGPTVLPAIDRLVDMGASLWRVHIDDTDWEATNDNADPFTFNWDYYDALYSTPRFEQAWGLMKALNDRGVADGLVLNFMGPGPAWMGGATLDPTKEDEFVEMILSFAYYARFNRGIVFHQLEPFNEPDWNGIEGILADPTVLTQVLDKMARRLDQLGMQDVRLVGPSTASTDQAETNYIPAMLADPVVMAKVRDFAIHSYSFDSSASRIGNLIAGSAYPDRHYWVNEQSLGTDAGFGPVDDLIDHVLTGAVATLVYKGYDGLENHNPSDYGLGLLALDTASQTYAPRQGFYVAEQVQKFIRPGAVRIAADESNPGLDVLAFRHPATGEVTILGRNTSGRAIPVSGSLANLPAVGALEFYYTDGSNNFRRLADVPVSGNSFSFSAPADSVFTLVWLPAPAVESVAVDDGAAQRSRVTALTVTFNTEVSAVPLATAFTLTRASDGATVGAVAAAVSVVDGKTVARLTFSGANTEAGSLSDGRWTVSVDRAKVLAADGAGMAADFTRQLFRLFGDSDGDGDVDVLDLGRFRQSFGTTAGQAGYADYFDGDGDGDVDVLDLGQFRQRFGQTLP